MDSAQETQTPNVVMQDAPVEEISPPAIARGESDSVKQGTLLQASELSPSRAEKIQDPERKSIEFVSNGLTGCHMEDILQEKSDQFIEKGRQIIILTAAGKPVYCYGREEEDLTNITGVIQALDANFALMRESLKSIETDRGFIVIEHISSLIFFCYYPKKDTSVLLIHEQFQLLYQQLLIILSKNAMDRLEKKQNYDIRELLGNSASMLTTLINQFDLSLGYALRCCKPVMMPMANRAAIRDMFMKVKGNDTLYCGIGINESVILSMQHKNYPLSPSNQLLLQTLISKTPAYRSSEGWLPICITDVQENAFLHLYVGFITDEMYVYFVTTGKDPEIFAHYSQLKDYIYQSLLSAEKMIELYSFYNDSLSVVETNVSGLIHFAFTNESNQLILPRLDDRIYDYRDYHKFIQEYKLVYSYMTKNNTTEYYESKEDYIIHATRKKNMIYIIVVCPFLQIGDVMTCRQNLTAWLTKKKDLFIQKSHMIL